MNKSHSNNGTALQLKNRLAVNSTFGVSAPTRLQVDDVRLIKDSENYKTKTTLHCMQRTYQGLYSQYLLSVSSRYLSYRPTTESGIHHTSHYSLFDVMSLWELFFGCQNNCCKISGRWTLSV